MKRQRHWVTAFLVTAAVFVFLCFYMREHEFRWVVENGIRQEYGLASMKSHIYFAFGSQRTWVSAPIAAAAVSLFIGAPLALGVAFIISRTRTHDKTNDA